ALKKGMINYSKLTRQIGADLNIDLKKNFDAILIACRRYYRKIKEEAILEKKIRRILKESKVEVKNKIMVIVLEKNIYLDNLLDLEKEIKKKQEDFHIIEGANAIIIITTEDFLAQIEKLFNNKIIRKNKNLAEITIKSPKEIETTSGVIAYLYSLFGEHGINIVETMSCWTDTIFVIKEEDVGKAMNILRF
ncbi:unnamed protein product, partial [marine sediment metagenome]